MSSVIRFAPRVLLVLYVALSLMGCRSTAESAREVPPSVEPAVPVSEAPASALPGKNSEPPGQEVTVYFAAPDASGLVGVTRSVPEGQPLLAGIVQHLIAGPHPSENLGATIPQGTKLLSLNVQKGIATVNFNAAFKQNHPGGSTGEILTLYSIVNSLTEVEDVMAVQFWMEGRPLDTLAGHITLEEPLRRNEGLIQQP